MSTTKLRASLARWQRRERAAKTRHTRAVKRGDKAAIRRHGDRLRQARKMVARRRRQLAERADVKPRIITAAQLGLRFQYVFGTKGTVYRGAGHYTAGHRSRNAAELAVEMRNDHRFHAGKGWGGLSYEAMVADDGTIGFGNPINRKSAAVASNNSGMVGICVPGTTGDRMTPACRASVDWLLDNWHTTKVPKAHRLPRPARELDLRGHHQFPSQSTACPGNMLADYRALFGARK